MSYEADQLRAMEASKRKLTITERQLRAIANIFGDEETLREMGTRYPVVRRIVTTSSEWSEVTDENYLTTTEAIDLVRRLREVIDPIQPAAVSVEIE